LEKVLKCISVLDPPILVQDDHRWKSTDARYKPDIETAERLKQLRLKERAQMEEYLTGRECHMRFLTRSLDDATAEPCGKCAVCRGKKVVTDKFSPETFKAAQIFLKRLEIPILPRKRLTAQAAAAFGLENTSIPPELRLKTGRALCRWGDPNYGELIRTGKYISGKFDQCLIDEAVAMIRDRWQPDPYPEWGCAVPSLRTPGLVADFAERLCKALEIPYIRCIRKIRETPQQKLMQNSAHQAANLLGAFQIGDFSKMTGKPLLLIDDLIDSGWTMTIAGMLLLSKGAGPVYPFALARTTRNNG
jgi:ATP-dependent DNA helicase RecQ